MTGPEELVARRAAFVESLGVVARLVRSREVGDAWESASVLDGYSVGGLCGHLLMGVRRVVDFLDRPPEAGAPVVEPGEYYAKAASFDPGANEGDLHVMLRGGGEELAGAGPRGIGERVDVLANDLAVRLPSVPASTLVPVLTMPGHAALLDGYLDTRFVEVVVHVDDVASSAGVSPPVLPALAYQRCLVVLQELAVRRAGPVEVVRAFARPDRARADALRSI